MNDWQARQRIGQIVLGLLVFTLIMQTGNSTAQDSIELSIHIPGEPAILNDNGLNRIITGFWHVMEFNSPTPDILIEITKDSEQYTWAYDGSNWEDMTHGIFIDGAKCSYVDGKVSLWMAVDSSAKLGIWQLEISCADDVTVDSVELIERTGGIGFSSPDFYIVVPPFEEKIIDTAQTGQYAKVHNEANIPMDVSFTIEDENCKICQVADFIHPASVGEYSLLYSAIPSAPQTKEILGDLLVKYKYIGPSLDMVQLTSSFNYPFNIQIIIGDPDLELVECGEYTLQYINSVRISHNETITLPLKINGINTVVLDIYGIDCDILSIENDEGYCESPLVLELTGTSVECFTISIEPTIVEGNAILVYDIDGEEYSTLIEVQGTVEFQEDTAHSETVDLKVILPPVMVCLLACIIVITIIYRKKRRVNK